MATIERRTEFCLWCGKECPTPQKYDHRKHKFVCGPVCGAFETTFTYAFSDDNITAFRMYEAWKKQTGG